MNTFKLKFSVEPFALKSTDDSENCGTQWADQEIWIDGVCVEASHIVDLNELINSLSQSGEFFIFTCECGIAGCAGIEEGVQVSHESELIHWNLLNPVSSYDIKPRNEWRNRATKISYVFERKQMLANIAATFADMKKQTGKYTHYMPFGFKREDFDNLRPIIGD
jgi:hypothetical protein